MKRLYPKQNKIKTRYFSKTIDLLFVKSRISVDISTSSIGTSLSERPISTARTVSSITRDIASTHKTQKHVTSSLKKMSGEETTEQRKARLAALRQSKSGSVASSNAPVDSSPVPTSASLGSKRKEATPALGGDDRLYEGQDEIIDVEDMAEVESRWFLFRNQKNSVQFASVLRFNCAFETTSHVMKMSKKSASPSSTKRYL